MSDWPSIADLRSDGPAPVALLGAPLDAGSVTAGRCDLAPARLRSVLHRLSTYDVETGDELAVRWSDRGDLPVSGIMPGDAFAAIRDGVAAALRDHDLLLLVGGNNAVTRPAVHGPGAALDGVGLVTLDAHFDLRGTDDGPRNGNPVRCLLEDGLPGRNICQIGLAPFANTAAMHRTAVDAGIGVFTIADVRARGIAAVVADALARLGHVELLVADFDIDVIDRAQLPGAPGARPGGMAVHDFFASARMIGADPRLRLADLTEYDPSLDASDLSALTAGRWMCELLAGFVARGAR